MKKIKVINFISILLISLYVFSCGSSDKSDIKTDDPDQAIKIAMKNYDKKDYLQAIDDFSLIKIKFSGTRVADKAQYYLAMCYYNRKEYILAASEFENLIKNFSSSTYTVQGRYQLAMCYYGMSPDFSLDQTYTKFAITEFQNFIELFPSDKNVSEAESKIKELRNKLAYKQLKSAELYMIMDNYKAAIYYYEGILQDYFETDWADDALYGKIQALLKKKKNEEALKEVERFEKKFPKSTFMSKIESIKNNLKKL